MEKKGFTLIEIMAVMVVLGLLITTIVPVVSNLLKDSEDTLHDEQIDLVVKASQKYMIENSNLLPEGSDYSAVYIDDLINSGVIDNDSVIDPKTKEELDGCVVVNYNENFNQYEYNYRDGCSINITFDPEGGSVDTTSKEVMIGKTYGELPEPTRDGYTFKGWRGKNMFDEETILMAIDGATKENGYYVFDVDKAYLEYKDGISTLDFKEDSQYVMTIKGYAIPNVAERVGYRIKFEYTDGTTSSEPLSSKTETILIYSSSDDKAVNYISMNYGYKGKIYLSYVQLEKGDTATPFEPYQEFTSDTIVNKSSDYTLHAIWEVAS